MYNGFIVLDSMRNNKSYDGNTLKFGISVGGRNYIVKLKKDYVTSLYSEHVASRFIRELGINCHETWLGYYKNEKVVILLDFTTADSKLRSYKDTRQSSEGTDLSNKEYTYKDVLYLINKHTKMSDVNKNRTVIQFWQMFICDAILANRDRHHGNWGHLMSKSGYKTAPIYDNGASLFPDVEKVIHQFAENKAIFIAERAEKFPASLFKMQRAIGEEPKRTNYYEMLSDLRRNKIMAIQVKQLKQLIGFDGVFNRITKVTFEAGDMIPEVYKKFYIMVVSVRYLHIIERESIEVSLKKTWRKFNETFR